MEPIKLMIVEDNADLRRMIGDYFASQEDMEVVATASNGAEAWNMLAARRPTAKRPCSLCRNGSRMCSSGT